ncbi:hypothetical protein Q0Z83_046970 [Actinoplanes sichuanensis]|uniref:Metallo-peptidase family M12B Reprolysin-like n=1 Tax=Actinoplanes sichuanensis TaxID=512349 RepID=A0ABW4A8I9_9ACTN|nr:hypothetical protein [Actinoplanes sichuanensis]BEL06506.1 hypothetical protein Q0Z83_046970 [Actinoplanes sichuanensis]
MCQKETCSSASELTFGTDGELITTVDEAGPCAIELLNGSWLIEVQPRNPTVLTPVVRGHLRIEVAPAALRVSGDIYTRRAGLVPPAGASSAVTPEPDEAGTVAPWYPSFPKSQYSWYLRSAGATYADGVLTVTIVRHLWNRSTQEFAATDTGTLTLRCRRGLIAGPQQMPGTLRVGGSVSTVQVTKTSTLYRGCHVEVDAMVNRRFPVSATIGSGAVATFQSVYATAGWDLRVTTDEINLPEDSNLTNPELQALLTGHQQSSDDELWRLWLLIGSAQGDVLGIMFDDDTAPRQGAVGFADARLGNRPEIAASARDQPLNNVPAAFLRTLVHEAGHALNLFHPKHDVHAPGIGTEIMNQTGDVLGFASAGNPYPGNASFLFSEHDRLSLVHAPDPQVRPGWKNFGWGHGTLSAGLPTAVDVAGLAVEDDADGLELTLGLPAQAYVGEFITAEVVLTNTGGHAREVTGLLTLAEGDLVFLRTSPQGRLDHLLDVTVGCGPRPMVRLGPGESVTGRVQVYFTNQGVTFELPGRHTVVARLVVDPITTVSSEPVPIDIRTPASDTEVAISAKTLSPGVGRALALGDFTRDETARAILTDLAESHPDTDTGAASALVMANSLARSFTDFRADTTRAADPDESARFLDLALGGRSAARAVELAVTVAAPTEKDAPVVADTLARLRRQAAPTADAGGDGDLAAAERVAEDFMRVRAR